jgi:HSP20 family protein
MSAAPRPEGPLAASVEKLRHELDRWMDAAWSQGERAMDRFGIRGRPWAPAADLIEDADSVRVLMNLPGLAAEDIDLTLTGHMLTVSGMLPGSDLCETSESLLCERPCGEFRRSIPLPASVEPETITAESRNGVLTVLIRKTEKEKARKVPVRSSEPAPTPTI